MTDAASEMDIGAKLERARTAHRQGDLSKSVPVYQEILRTHPDHAEVLQLLGVAMLQTGDLAESVKLLDRAATLTPDNAKIQNNLGAALLTAGRLHEAEQRFSNAVELAPEFDEAQYNLGRALHALGRQDEALARYRRTIELNQNHAPAHNNIGAMLVLSSKFNEGLDYLRRAVKLAPDSGEILSNAVYALERTNNVEEAAAHAEELIRIASDLPMAKIVRARIARRNGKLTESARLATEVTASSCAPSLKVEAFFELSRTLDAIGDYPRAFKACTDAKQLRMTLPDALEWDRRGYRERVAKYRAWSTAARIRSGPMPEKGPRNPVFFVGFPRSGTTLVEQILDAHPGLVTIDERTPLNFIDQASEELIGRRLNLPDDIDSLSDQEIARLREGFFRFAQQLTGDELSQRRLVDKLPLNIVRLGLVNRIFPDAKVLAALRDPRDCCLSCYMQSFSLYPAMLNFLELETTGQFYATVMDLWLHYRSIISIPWMEYRYEDLVEDFDGTVGRMLDFIGVPWNDAVKNYADHARSRNISTPSYSAVIKPISKSAVDRWRNYRVELAPIQPMLDPFIKAFGYETV